MDLDPTKIHEAFIYCRHRLYDKEEHEVEVLSVNLSVRFNVNRLLERRKDIRDTLLELPEAFMQSRGGMSFSSIRYDKYWRTWSDQFVIHDELVALGIGVDLIRFLTPRETWHLLPSRAPFIVIKDR